jgi:hypothetical protein
VQFPAQLGVKENSGECVSSFHVFSVLVAWAGKRSKDSAISSGSADRLCCSAAVGKCEMVRKGKRGKSDNRWASLSSTAIGEMMLVGPWRVMSGEDVAASGYQMTCYRGCARCE